MLCAVRVGKRKFINQAFRVNKFAMVLAVPYTYVLCNDSSWLVRKARLPPMGPAQTEILGPTTFFFDRSLSLAASS